VTVLASMLAKILKSELVPPVLLIGGGYRLRNGKACPAVDRKWQRAGKPGEDRDVDAINFSLLFSCRAVRLTAVCTPR
jgi:hypothetical protein